MSALQQLFKSLKTVKSPIFSLLPFFPGRQKSLLDLLTVPPLQELYAANPIPAPLLNTSILLF
jgi:hypothetical protein